MIRDLGLATKVTEWLHWSSTARPSVGWLGGGRSDFRRARVTAGTSLRPYAGDPDPSVGASTTSLDDPNVPATDAHSLVVDNTAVTGVIPVGLYRPLAQPVATTGRFGGSRRIKRLTETREIRVRSTHRRRKFVARGGVLAGFGLAMVVYPVMGNVVEYHRNAAEAVPGVVLGQSPATGHALLGDGPSLIPTVLDLPTADESSLAYVVADTGYMYSPLLPNCVPPASFEGEINGQLPADHLCLLPDGKNYLRADAAQSFAQMNEQFKAEFGRSICIGEGYRSYGDQVRIKSLRGYLAASPGTSMHGYGVAFDLCGGDDKGAPKEWLEKKSDAYGFFNPNWAKYRLLEPWHFEYKPGTDALGYYDNWDQSSLGSWKGSGDGTAPATDPAPPTTPAVPDPQPTVAPVAPVVPPVVPPTKP